jgi:hypothetical protein
LEGAKDAMVQEGRTGSRSQKERPPLFKERSEEKQEYCYAKES